MAVLGITHMIHTSIYSTISKINILIIVFIVSEVRPWSSRIMCITYFLITRFSCISAIATAIFSPILCLPQKICRWRLSLIGTIIRSFLGSLKNILRYLHYRIRWLEVLRILGVVPNVKTSKISILFHNLKYFLNFVNDYMAKRVFDTWKSKFAILAF